MSYRESFWGESGWGGGVNSLLSQSILVHWCDPNCAWSNQHALVMLNVDYYVVDSSRDQLSRPPDTKFGSDRIWYTRVVNMTVIVIRCHKTVCLNPVYVLKMLISTWCFFFLFFFNECTRNTWMLNMFVFVLFFILSEKGKKWKIRVKIRWSSVTGQFS